MIVNCDGCLLHLSCSPGCECCRCPPNLADRRECSTSARKESHAWFLESMRTTRACLEDQPPGIAIVSRAPLACMQAWSTPPAHDHPRLSSMSWYCRLGGKRGCDAMRCHSVQQAFTSRSCPALTLELLATFVRTCSASRPRQCHQLDCDACISQRRAASCTTGWRSTPCFLEQPLHLSKWLHRNHNQRRRAGREHEHLARCRTRRESPQTSQTSQTAHSLSGGFTASPL